MLLPDFPAVPRGYHPADTEKRAWKARPSAPREDDGDRCQGTGWKYRASAQSATWSPSAFPTMVEFR
jgi:hypothetical protein